MAGGEMVLTRKQFLLKTRFSGLSKYGGKEAQK